MRAAVTFHRMAAYYDDNRHVRIVVPFPLPHPEKGFTMLKHISTLATAAVLAVSLAGPAFAQSSSSQMSSHTAMKHTHSMGHKSSMSHGTMSHGTMAHGSMAHGAMSSDPGMKHGANTSGTMGHTKKPPSP